MTDTTKPRLAAARMLNTLRADKYIARNFADELFQLGSLIDAQDRLAALAGAAPVAWLLKHPAHGDMGPTDDAEMADYWRENGVEVTPLFTHAPAKAREEWQPIATAPKSVADGSHVSGVYLLGFVPDEEMDFDPNACIDIVWWEPLLPNNAGTRGKWCRSAGSSTVECEPTHWRPLPATPAALATFAEGAE